MRFARLTVVTLLVTLSCGALGGAVGGLLGYAFPSSFGFAVDAQGAAGGQATETEKGGVQGQAAVQLQPPRSFTTIGGAVGAAFGLLGGAILGLLLGAVDQALLALRDARGKKDEVKELKDPKVMI
jgi:hypothetical protein